MYFDRARHEMIKAHLRIAGSSMAAISRELGISQTTVTNTVLGKAVSHRVQEAVAEKLGQSASDIFPERYQSKTGGDN